MQQCVRARDTFAEPPDITKWVGGGLQEMSNGNCRDEFRCIKEKFANIIDAKVIFNGGAASLEKVELT